MLYNECLSLISKRKDNIISAVKKLFKEAEYGENESEICAGTVLNTVIDFIVFCEDITDSDAETRTDAVNNLFDDINRLCYPDVMLYLAEIFGLSVINDDEELYLETPSADEFTAKILSYSETQTAPLNMIPAHSELILLCEEAAKQFIQLEKSSRKAKYADGLKLTAQQVYIICTINSLIEEKSDSINAIKIIKAAGMLYITGYSVGYGEMNPGKAVKTFMTLPLLQLTTSKNIQNIEEKQPQSKLNTDSGVVKNIEPEKNKKEENKTEN